jgi:hypothetical protein
MHLLDTGSCDLDVKSVTDRQDLGQVADEWPRSKGPWNFDQCHWQWILSRLLGARLFYHLPPTEPGQKFLVDRTFFEGSTTSFTSDLVEQEFWNTSGREIRYNAGEIALLYSAWAGIEWLLQAPLKIGVKTDLESSSGTTLLDLAGEQIDSPEGVRTVLLQHNPQLKYGAITLPPCTI